MSLAPASFDPGMVKGDKLKYCKGLIASVGNHHALVEQSFHSVLCRDKDLKHKEFHLLEKTCPERLSSTLLERPVSGTVNQPCAAKLQRINPWIHVSHLQKAPKPD